MPTPHTIQGPQAYAVQAFRCALYGLCPYKAHRKAEGSGCGRLDLGEERRYALDRLAAGAGAELGERPGVFAQRREQALAGLWQVGSEQQRRHPHALAEVVEDLVEAL